MPPSSGLKMEVNTHLPTRRHNPEDYHAVITRDFDTGARREADKDRKREKDKVDLRRRYHHQLNFKTLFFLLVS